MSLTPEHEADIRSKVNPLYRDQRGTESHERAMLLGEIDRLRAEVVELRTKHEVACGTIQQQRNDIDTIRGYMDTLKESSERHARRRDDLLRAMKEIRATATPLNYAAGYTAMKHIADAALAKDKP